jgi:hypothetical protein
VTRRRIIADPVAGIHDQCLLCGGQAHAYSEDGGHTLEVWDLCRRCNAAFVAAAERVAATLGPHPIVAQVIGQIELDDL